MAEQLGILNNYAGVVVSLNQKRATYLGIGPLENNMFKVWLSPQVWCAKLPADLTPSEAEQVRRAINQGVLVSGRQYLPVVKKDKTVIKKYIDHVKQSYGVDAKAKAPFQHLVLTRQEGHFTAAEIITACLSEEERTKRRAPWIAFLNDALKAYDGPDVIVHDYSDNPETDLIEEPVRVTMPQEIPIPTPSDPIKQETPVDKKKAKEVAKALDKFLGEAL